MSRIKTVLSGVLATILLIAQYIVGNSPLPLSDYETEVLKFYEVAKQLLFPVSSDKNNEWLERITLVNTSACLKQYDSYDEVGLKVGTEVRTSRKDLFSFLKDLDQYGEYGYILLDVKLDPLRDEPYDDSLKVLIDNMDCIVLAKSNDSVFLSDSFEKKSGSISYYYTPLSSTFMKFNLLGDEGVSLPLKMYQEIDHRTVKKKAGAFYFDGNKLCSKALIPKYEVHIIKNSNDNNVGIPAILDDYFNLGEDTNQFDLINFSFKDQIIVIGDFFESDLYDTYAGKMSGALINLNTYLSLSEGRHIISYPYIVFLWLLYFLLTLGFFTMYHREIKSQVLRKIMNSYTVLIVISLIGWGFLFQMISLGTYVFVGHILNPWLPFLWFNLLTILLEVQTKKKSYHE